MIQYPALLPFVENLRSRSINNETKSKDLDKPFLGTIQILLKQTGGYLGGIKPNAKFGLQGGWVDFWVIEMLTAVFF